MIYSLESQVIAKNGTSKLTPDDVIAIRQAVANKTVSQYALARRYGVSQALISKIINRKVWPEL